MFIQNLLSKLQNFRKFYALHGYKSHFLTRQTFTSTLDTQVQTKRFATKVLPPGAAPPGVTVPSPAAVPPKNPAGPPHVAPPIVAPPVAPPVMAAQVAAKPYAANTKTDRKVSSLTGMREFFMHPLTWDRNNGYFNILLGLAIFGYCFCTACTLDKPDKMSFEPKDKTK